MNAYKTKAPGSLMLLGEYAVLNGAPAIVLAIDQFIHVTIKPRMDTEVHIHSYLGNYQADIRNLPIHPPFQYVLTALTSKLKFLKTGCNIDIHNEFPARIGLGSSAAVTIATLGALYLCIESRIPNKIDLWKEGLTIIQEVQGAGSGADLAASLWGGTLLFSNSPLNIKPLLHYPPLAVLYSGKNEITTANAIPKVTSRLRAHDKNHGQMDIHSLVLRAADHINHQDWHALGSCLTEGQKYMKELGVSPPFLEDLVQALAEQPQISGAKISGAGFGDCLIGIGQLPPTVFPRHEKEKDQGVRQIPLSVSPFGLTSETHPHLCVGS